MHDIVGAKATIALILGLFLAVNVGGFFAAEYVMMDSGTHDCPFMGVPALCNMSPVEHITQWQQLFTTTVPQFLALFLLLVGVIATIRYFIQSLASPQQERKFTRQFRRPERLYDPLRIALARGILHSKAF